MDVEQDQTSESTPDTATTGFAEYKSKQAAAKAAPDGPPDAEPESGANEAEPAPAKEISPEPKKNLTVEERSQRDRERGERRRIEFLNRKVGEERAGREAAERRTAELEKKPESAPGTRQAVEGEPIEPQIENFETTAEFNKANAAYLKAVAKAEVVALTKAQDEKAARDQADKARQEIELEAQEHVETYKERASDYGKTDKEYQPAFEAISTALDRFNGTSQDRYIDALILKSSVGPEVVTHLYKNPEVFKELLNASRDEAHTLFGRLEALLSSKAPEPRTTTGAPRPGRTVTGRSTSTNPDEKLKAAAAKGDFTAFQMAAREKERASRR